MQKIVEKLELTIGKGRIKQDEPLASHTASKASGNATYYIETENVDELIKLVKAARLQSIPLFIIGSGAWINEGQKLEGLVIKNNCHRFELMSFRGTIKSQKIGLENVSVYAQAGTNMNQLVRFTINEGLSGLEYQLGLPGTVGGAIHTNARYTPKSIYVLDAVDKIRLLNTAGEIEEVEAQYFARKNGTFIQPAEEVILSVTFRMNPEDKKILWERAEEAVEQRNKV